MNFNNALHKSKTNPCPLNAGIQSVKQAEDPVVEFWVDSHTIIPYKENRFSVFIHSASTNLDRRIRLLPHELGRIADQVLHDLDQPGPVAMNYRKILLNL